MSSILSCAMSWSKSSVKLILWVYYIYVYYVSLCTHVVWVFTCVQWFDIHTPNVGGDRETALASHLYEKELQVRALRCSRAC